MPPTTISVFMPTLPTRSLTRAGSRGRHSWTGGTSPRFVDHLPFSFAANSRWLLARRPPVQISRTWSDTFKSTVPPMASAGAEYQSPLHCTWRLGRTFLPRSHTHTS